VAPPGGFRGVGMRAAPGNRDQSASAKEQQIAVVNGLSRCGE
jgi:hypothetical protein